jgi:hypothetical protein
LVLSGLGIVLGTVNFAGIFALPVASLLQGPIESNGSRPRAIIHATAAVPAFIRAKKDGRFSLLRVGYKDIQGTNLNTVIAAIADLRIEDSRPVGSGNIGNRVDLVFGHIFSFYEAIVFSISKNDFSDI